MKEAKMNYTDYDCDIFIRTCDKCKTLIRDPAEVTSVSISNINTKGIIYLCLDCFKNFNIWYERG